MLELDGFGITGAYLHYALLSCMCLSALLVMIVTWKNGSLKFDESPKYTLFEEE